ncbi:putative disease resistance protein At3g14460 [Vigna angularis]|uniref:putative disease resistance protein At3g14460 n=1 Tax=Phaseolus angularis TaxID=3914 RepID=UPI0022B5D515|nr:putative disease resistance protein At3g14460 [Vigna angularis]XP_052724917.1 putative disease resistance protein At3g14460 [Vigna angularis]XP_052724918.1 putative disease resistance protein At3g14460 [Vigna angularis]XP_052724919.1 putative disease resistance protein At3g14460 [Vigna angularis]XP_052724920.1 putative disease resistance protein At3g14460 [Vigna angularis]XP_052724921.1 putative disease resistance protein At3g14460 [Vigna angularis]XP_052724922.1 putative disease resistanc
MALAVVGGALLSAFFDVLFDRLASPEVLNFIRGKKPDKLLQKVKTQLIVVRVVLADAEKRQITDSNVKEWLALLRDVVYEVDDLLDEVSTKAASQKEVSNSFSHLFKTKKIVSITKLEDIVERLDDILKQKENLDLKEIPVESYQPWKAQPTSLEDGYAMYGRDKDKDAIMKMVLEDSTNGETVSVIPIVGMGGVGKPTLARSVFNDGKLKQKIFDLKAWVCVSDIFDIVKVTRTMIEEITRKPCKLSDLNALQLELMDELKDKRLLIVLDDVWIEDCDNWNSLTKPFLSGIRGSKVLITTRNENVAAAVPFHTVEVYHLSKLSNEDCWLVFANHAFPPSEASETRGTLKKIGKEIVKRCNGLPLAAQSLGGMLRRKQTIRDWNNVLQSDIWELPENQCKIIPALRISYNYLPPHLKRCFVYCSLYPKDFEFEKDELIQLWMAEDLVKAAKKGKTLEEVGQEYFYDLVSRFFFQSSSRSGGAYFVMHDLIHDLATFLGGDFYFRTDELEKETNIDRKTRHLSFTRFSDPVSDIKAFDTVKFPRTFLLIDYKDSPFNNEKALHIIVSRLKYLRVLSLWKFQSQLALPDSVGELIHLRYLNLSRISIETLPESLCNLCNLQTLKLSYCSELTKLPSSMQNLVNLRHLEIFGTRIKEMPKRMGKLNQLRTLDCYVVGKHTENSIKELGGLPNLHGTFYVQKLENVTKGEEALEARIMDKNHISNLSLEWSIANDNSIDFQVELDVLSKLEPHQDLEALSIIGYKGTRFPEWVGNFSYLYMTSIGLYNCNNCCMLPSLGQLPSLRNLFISNMNSVKTIDAGFYKKDDCSSVTPFPSLESLHISNMPCWEVWNSFDSEAFPVLKNLYIEKCPKLKGDLPNHLPALQTLEIRNCELLVSSVPGPLTLRTLEIRKCKKVAFREFPLLVESIKVEGGPMVESMMEAISNIQPTCLQSLKLQNCSSDISFRGGRLPASLKTLDIRGINKLKFPLQHKHELLESLSINNSDDSLTSLPLAIFPNLTSLRITNCENMESLLVSGSEISKRLNTFAIDHCPNFVSFPGEGLCMPNLTSFTVCNCDKLKSLPDQMGTLVPKMEYLSISNCQQIESFPGGGMPPNLRTVFIENCVKLLSNQAWVCMDMVTSLSVWGPCDGIKSFPKESLLPPSLVSLDLFDLSSLETLDCKGLLHLTSLQQLNIERCQKLENIAGEKLPLSLIELTIYKCPLLKQRCHKKDRQIWPKICHVRGINIEGRWI